MADSSEHSDTGETGTTGDAHAQTDTEPSLVDELQRPAMMHYIKLAVAAFALVGVGYGVTFWLFSQLGDFGASGGAMLVGIGSFFGFLLGPVVAVATGWHTGADSEEDETVTVAAAAGVGAAAGFVVLVMILLVFASLSSSGGSGTGGGGGSLPGGAAGTLGLLLGIASTSALTVYVEDWLASN